MIVAVNSSTATWSEVSSASLTLDADTTPPLGKGQGFRPHELLDAALASCMAITLRTVATERGIALEQAQVTIEVDRAHEAETVFRARVDLRGVLSDAERKLLLVAVRHCPVRKTLAKQLSFVESEGA